MEVICPPWEVAWTSIRGRSWSWLQVSSCGPVASSVTVSFVVCAGSLPKSVAEFVERIREHIYGGLLVGVA